jgi:hypothetical protein
MDDAVFRRCSTCKREIPFGALHYVCSVSTCTRKGTDFAFCTVECWDAHVPLFRHRDAWAEERTAPTPGQHAEARRVAAEREVQRTERAQHPPEPTPIAPTGPIPNDPLVVASKLKAYVSARSGLRTSDTVFPVLSDKLRELCDAAIERAAQAGRKTILDRDF